jgi:5-methylcytosine-specific restriction endonuclease McrA
MKSRDIRDRVATKYRHCFEDDLLEALVRLNDRAMADYLEWLMQRTRQEERERIREEGSGAGG